MMKDYAAHPPTNEAAQKRQNMKIIGRGSFWKGSILTIK